MRLMAILSLAGLAVLAAFPAFADKFSAEGMFCSSPEGATAFVHAWNGKNSAEAADVINKAAGKNVCSLGVLLLEEVERTTKITVATGTWQLVKVNIWGVVDAGATINFPAPLAGYTYIQVELPKLGQAI